MMIPKMKLQLQRQEFPDIWKNLEGTWTDQYTYEVSAQILLGADHTRYFPYKVRNKSGDLLQTEQARLMQSAITGSYIIFGQCETYSQNPNNPKSCVSNNQVQTSRPTSEDEEVWTSILDEMIIEVEVHMEVQQESD